MQPQSLNEPWGIAIRAISSAVDRLHSATRSWVKSHSNRHTTGLTLAVLICVAACGGGQSPSASPSPVAPVAPSSPAPASISVTGFLPSADYPAQFTATAKMPDGSTQNVTSMATWQSSNAAVMAVSTAGVVNGIAAGEGNITATYQGVSGVVHVIVQANLWGAWAGTMTVTSSNQSVIPNDQCNVTMSVTSEEPRFFSGAPLNITGGHTDTCHGPTGALIEGEFPVGSQGTDVVYPSERLTFEAANGANIHLPPGCSFNIIRFGNVFNGTVVGTTIHASFSQNVGCTSPSGSADVTFAMDLTKQ